MYVRIYICALPLRLHTREVDTHTCAHFPYAYIPAELIHIHMRTPVTPTYPRSWYEYTCALLLRLHTREVSLLGVNMFLRTTQYHYAKSPRYGL